MKDVKEYVIVQTSTCMIGITHLQNVLILPHSSHFNNITDLNVSKCIVVSVGRTSRRTDNLTNNRRLFNCDNRWIETHQSLITSLHSQ